ncbi:MAG TPA: tetratricopeptide repeat protein [Kofleriaceae bacterium]|nr:tetratricopeptide repeat protein [Kofleriaceae bacterium]
MKRITCLLFALFLVPALVPALASAQPKTAEEWYKEGETQYNLGNFTDAIEAFKKAFSLETVDSKKSAYLYNIAQSYRYAKDCSNAQFFYKRFLALRDSDKSKPLDPKKRAEIEARIKELEDCARQQEAIKNKPPDNLKPDDPSDTKNNGKGDPSNKGPDVSDKGNGKGDGKDDGTDDTDDTDDVKVTKTAEAPPRVVSVRLVGGGAKISAGDLNVPLQATGALIGGYPIALDKLVLELGAGFTFTPVPYEGQMMASKTAQLIGLVANAGATYTLIPKLGLRGDVGLGVQWFNGIGESPFTSFQPTSGALPMFHVRVAVSADYAITPNVVATVVPIAFSYSPPASGLRDDIKSIQALDFMIGLGYRM